MVGKMLRVTANQPCPVCGKPDWCLRAKDGSAAICTRVHSSRLIQRPGRDSAGFLHVLSENAQYTGRAERKVDPAPRCKINWPKLAASFALELSTARLTNLATLLGLSTESLARLNVGWSTWHRAYSFPMRTADGTIVGIRLRKPNGFKYCVKGSRSALFIPEDLVGVTRLYITEGPTDCAALLGLGFDAVGRPSCSGGVRLLTDLVKVRRPSEVAIVADADAPGQAGAARLADVLVPYVLVRILTPPAKDAREWLRLGIARDAVIAAASATNARKLRISTRLCGEGR